MDIITLFNEALAYLNDKDYESNKSGFIIPKAKNIEFSEEFIIRLRDNIIASL
jgi:hypothetical protein